jgi:hypothetical protein
MSQFPITLATLGVSLLLSLAIGCQDKPKPPSAVEDHSQHGNMDHKESDSSQAAELILSMTPEKPRASEVVDMRIMLHDASGKMLKDFEPTHEKKAHLILVREGLDEFAHTHPTVGPSGTMTAKHTFPRGGNYFVFLDHKPSGKPAATSKTKLIIEGEAAPAPTLTPNVPGTLQGDGLQANVSLRSAADKSQVMSFAVQDEKGKAIVDLQPYLGAMGHLVVLSADGEQYVHAHPLTEKSPDGKVEFEVHFPGPGIYKAWGQFQRDGKVITIPAVVNVEAAGHKH